MAVRSAATPFNRRRLVAGGALAVAAVTGCGGREEDLRPAGALGRSDLEVVDFALGLERFERDFYERVLREGVLSGEARRLASRIHANEREHVAALAAVLRDNDRRASPAPRLNPAVLDTTEEEVLSLAAKLEDLGANAYSGAAATILSRDVLKAALAIHTVEARHAAALHRLLGTEFVPEGAFATPLDRNAVAEELAPFVL